VGKGRKGNPQKKGRITGKGKGVMSLIKKPVGNDCYGVREVMASGFSRRYGSSEKGLCREKEKGRKTRRKGKEKVVMGKKGVVSDVKSEV